MEWGGTISRGRRLALVRGALMLAFATTLAMVVPSMSEQVAALLQPAPAGVSQRQAEIESLGIPRPSKDLVHPATRPLMLRFGEHESWNVNVQADAKLRERDRVTATLDQQGNLVAVVTASGRQRYEVLGGSRDAQRSASQVAMGGLLVGTVLSGAVGLGLLAQAAKGRRLRRAGRRQSRPVSGHDGWGTPGPPPARW